MEVEIDDEHRVYILQRYQEAKELVCFKFVLVETERGRLLRLFEDHIEHSKRLARNEEDNFVGAGEVFFGRLKWGSASIKYNIHRDRPAIKEEADRILMEIKEKLGELLGGPINITF